LTLLKAEQPKAALSTGLIARAHGHEVLFTPPYHPELQPNELIWAVAKNRLRRNPVDSAGALVPRRGAGAD